MATKKNRTPRLEDDRGDGTRPQATVLSKVRGQCSTTCAYCARPAVGYRVFVPTDAELIDELARRCGSRSVGAFLCVEHGAWALHHLEQWELDVLASVGIASRPEEVTR